MRILLREPAPLASHGETEYLGRAEREHILPVHIRRDQRHVQNGQHLLPRPLHDAGEKDAAHGRAHALGGEGIGTARKIHLLIPRGDRRAQDGAHVGGILQPVEKEAALLGRREGRCGQGDFRKDALRRLFVGDCRKGVAAQDGCGRKKGLPRIPLPHDDAQNVHSALRGFAHHFGALDEEAPPRPSALFLL